MFHIILALLFLIKVSFNSIFSAPKFYLNKIDNSLSNKQKRLLLKYVSHNFGSVISD